MYPYFPCDLNGGGGASTTDQPHDPKLDFRLLKVRTPKPYLLNRLPVCRWSDLPLLAGLALLYALLAKVSLNYFLGNSVVAIVWLPSGLALAALLMGGKQYSPGVFIGAWIGNVVKGKSAWVSASLALGNTVELAVGV